MRATKSLLYYIPLYPIRSRLSHYHKVIVLVTKERNGIRQIKKKIKLCCNKETMQRQSYIGRLIF